MKKIVSFIICLTFLITLTACGSTDNPAASVTASLTSVSENGSSSVSDNDIKPEETKSEVSVQPSAEEPVPSHIYPSSEELALSHIDHVDEDSDIGKLYLQHRKNHVVYAKDILNEFEADANFNSCYLKSVNLECYFCNRVINNYYDLISVNWRDQYEGTLPYFSKRTFDIDGDSITYRHTFSGLQYDENRSKTNLGNSYYEWKYYDNIKVDLMIWAAHLASLYIDNKIIPYEYNYFITREYMAPEGYSQEDLVIFTTDYYYEEIKDDDSANAKTDKWGNRKLGEDYFTFSYFYEKILPDLKDGYTAEYLEALKKIYEYYLN